MTCIILTRAQPQVQRWEDALLQANVHVISLPLLELAGVNDSRRHDDALRLGGQWRAVMFVSSAAVEYFFKQQDRPDLRDIQCWATGPGTAGTLEKWGVLRENIIYPSIEKGQFDSESLWAEVCQSAVTAISPGDRVLIVRGRDSDFSDTGRGSGRDWLANKIEEQGAVCEYLVVYERRRPCWNEAQKAKAEELMEQDFIWIFNSSQALRNLKYLLGQADYSNMQCWVTHPRIGSFAEQMGISKIKVIGVTLPELLCEIEKT
jgi:uroporphyrinogen-III synthase